MKVIILLGRQGSGKGTQAKLLLKDYDLSYIGSGEVLRSFYEGPTFSAKKTKRVLHEGGYVPTALIFWLWMGILEDIKQKGTKGILFDGSPRKLLETELLDQALEWYEWSGNLVVVLIDISREEAFSRLTNRRICEKCGKPIPFVGKAKGLKACDTCGGRLVTRPDDRPEAINSRLDLFEKETGPVIEYYRKNSVLKEVDGSRSIEEVYKDIKALLF